MPDTAEEIRKQVLAAEELIRELGKKGQITAEYHNRMGQAVNSLEISREAIENKVGDLQQAAIQVRSGAEFAEASLREAFLSASQQFELAGEKWLAEARSCRQAGEDLRLTASRLEVAQRELNMSIANAVSSARKLAIRLTVAAIVAVCGLAALILWT